MPEIIIQDSQSTMERLAGLLLVRRQEIDLVERPIDRKVAVAKLDAVADAVARMLNGWGPEQVITQVEEAFSKWRPQEGRNAFSKRRQELVQRLFLLNQAENRGGVFAEI